MTNLIITKAHDVFLCVDLNNNNNNNFVTMNLIYKPFNN